LALRRGRESNALSAKAARFEETLEVEMSPSSEQVHEVVCLRAHGGVSGRESRRDRPLKILAPRGDISHLIGALDQQDEG